MNGYDTIREKITAELYAYPSEDIGRDALKETHPGLAVDNLEMIDLSKLEDKEQIKEDMLNTLKRLGLQAGNDESNTLHGEWVSKGIRYELDLAARDNIFAYPSQAAAEDNPFIYGTALDKPEILKEIVNELVEKGSFGQEILERDYKSYLERYLDTMKVAYMWIIGGEPEFGYLPAGYQIGSFGEGVAVPKMGKGLVIVEGSGKELVENMKKQGFGRYAEVFADKLIASDLVRKEDLSMQGLQKSIKEGTKTFNKYYDKEVHCAGKVTVTLLKTTKPKQFLKKNPDVDLNNIRLTDMADRDRLKADFVHRVTTGETSRGTADYDEYHWSSTIMRWQDQGVEIEIRLKEADSYANGTASVHEPFIPNAFLNRSTDEMAERYPWSYGYVYTDPKTLEKLAEKLFEEGSYDEVLKVKDYSHYTTDCFFAAVEAHADVYGEPPIPHLKEEGVAIDMGSTDILSAGSAEDMVKQVRDAGDNKLANRIEEKLKERGLVDNKPTSSGKAKKSRKDEMER